MKKVLSQLMTIAVVFVFFACSESDQIINCDQQLIPQRSSYRVSKEMAVETAIKALVNLDQNTNGSTRTISKDWKVNTLKYYKSKQTRSSANNNDTLFYILNFEGGGFAIVPTDERASDVYALSLEDSVDIQNNEGVAFYMSMAADYLNTELRGFVGNLPPEGGDSYGLL